MVNVNICLLVLQAHSQELAKPPTSPEIEEPVQQAKRVKTPTVVEGTPKLRDNAENMIVEGKALHIISDSNR